MKNQYLPVIFVLMVMFVLCLFADETLLEDLNMSGYLKQGSGVTFLPATTAGSQTNNAILQFSNGTNTFTRRVLIGVNAPDSYNTSLGGPLYLNNTNNSFNTMIILDNTNSEAIISIGNHATAHQVQIRQRASPDEIWFRFRQTTSPTRFGHDAGVGFQFQPTDGTTVLDIENGATTNFTPFVGMVGITASNFQQRVGSTGGFVGNGAGLTNLSGTGVGGFTPGSVIFAGASGSLSQDNASFFWDITNRRLGLGTSAPSSQFHLVNTNSGVNNIMIDGYGVTPDLITRIANGTFASPTAVTNGQILSAVSARGYGTTGFPAFGSARIRFEASEAFTDTAKGSRIVFFTTPSTTTNVTESMRIHNDGSVGIGTNTIVSATKLYVNGSVGAATSIYAGGSPLISATNTFIGVSVGGVTGDLGAMYCTNVMADFPSTLTLAGADISYPVPSTIITNMVVNIGRPSTETTGLMTVGYISSNGFVTIRARNATAGTIDQGNLPYTIHVLKVPTINTLP